MLAVAISLSGCSSLKRWLVEASHTKGTAEARVVLPDWPADCRVVTPHAPLVVGTEIRSILKRERTQLNKANSRVLRCADHYTDLQERFQ